jgi:hypothetical protein
MINRPSRPSLHFTQYDGHFAPSQAAHIEIVTQPRQRAIEARHQFLLQAGEVVPGRAGLDQRRCKSLPVDRLGGAPAAVVARVPTCSRARHASKCSSRARRASKCSSPPHLLARRAPSPPEHATTASAHRLRTCWRDVLGSDELAPASAHRLRTCWRDVLPPLPSTPRQQVLIASALAGATCSDQTSLRRRIFDDVRVASSPFQ